MSEITRTMEKRSAVNLILLVAGVALAAVIGSLLIKVRSPASTPKLDPGELARAQARAARPAQPAPSRGPLSRSPADDGAEDPWAPESQPVPAGRPAAADITLERLGAAGLAGAAAGGAVVEDDQDDPAALPMKMTEATRLYDRGDYEGAGAAAAEVLAQQPDNVKMLRVAVSSACIMGDQATARSYFGRLPPRDQRQMERRCGRYSVEF
jgi:hypothetical protein